MKRVPLDSKNLKSVGYDAGTMQVEFNNGRLYNYQGEHIDQHYQSLVHAASPGEYFNSQVRHNPKIIGREVSK